MRAPDDPELVVESLKKHGLWTADEIRREYQSIVSNGFDVSGVNFEQMAKEYNSDARIVRSWRAPVAPKGWIEKDRRIGMTFYVHPQSRLKVGISCAFENDGRPWLHLSVSHPDRIPTWGELGIAKRAFLGDREAYQVLPPERNYVNIHPHVLNVYALLDENAGALPDFTRGQGGI